jgi:chromosome partitioning protein
MTKRMSIVNQKGGVGKTTTTCTIAYILATELKKKVLVVDCDSQRNTTSRLETEETKNHSLYDLLTNESILTSQVINKTKYDNLFLIPADARLGKLTESSFPEDHPSPKLVLRQKINEIEKYFDYILFDCAPAINLMTISSLIASTAFLVPTEISEDACNGVRAIHKVINGIRKAGIGDLKNEGVLICRYAKANSIETKRILQLMEEEFKDCLFDVKIPDSVKVGESNNKRATINSMYPKDRAAKAYRVITEKLL